MKSYARHASVRWLGSRQGGKGAIDSPSGSLNLAVHEPTGDTKRGGTTAPELAAAAVAGSFSFTLANELGEAGYKPRQIDTTVTLRLEYLAARWTLTQISLDVTASVPELAECDFVDATLQAKANCPISRALNANILISAKLTRDQ